MARIVHWRLWCGCRRILAGTGRLAMASGTIAVTGLLLVEHTSIMKGSGQD
jgi:hypothetical protein